MYSVRYGGRNTELPSLPRARHLPETPTCSAIQKFPEPCPLEPFMEIYWIGTIDNHVEMGLNKKDII